jgi:C-methyltransferase-like protein/methyltransferase family protein
VTFVSEFYDERYGSIGADAVICRHTLEHIPDVFDFMRTVRTGIGDALDTVVLWEVPDVTRVLADTAFWDVYYEHCSYFTPGSLARVFRRERLAPISLRLDYDNQYVLIEARPGNGPTPALELENDLAEAAHLVEHFREEFPVRVDSLRSMLDSARQHKGRVVIWGGGSKGVSFLTTLGIEDEIEYAVDINPHKQGKFMAGTGQEVVAPSFLVEYRPDLVILMNPVYRDEVQRELDSMGLTSHLVAV